MARIHSATYVVEAWINTTIFDGGEIGELQQRLDFHNNATFEVFSFLENAIGLRLWFVDFVSKVYRDTTLQQAFTRDLDPSIFYW